MDAREWLWSLELDSLIVQSSKRGTLGEVNTILIWFKEVLNGESIQIWTSGRC